MSRTRKERYVKATNARNWQHQTEGWQYANYMSVLITRASEFLRPLFLDPFVRFGNSAIAIITAPLIAILAWREAALAKTPYSYTKAVIETAAAGAIVAAAIGIMAAVAAFAFVAPILLAAAMGLRFAFSLGSAIHFAVKIHQTKQMNIDPELKEEMLHELREDRNNAIADTVFGGIMTVTTVLLAVFAAPAVQIAAAAVGIATALGGIIYSFIKSYRESIAAKKVEEEFVPSQSSEAKIAIMLGKRKHVSNNHDHIEVSRPTPSASAIEKMRRPAPPQPGTQSDEDSYDEFYEEGRFVRRRIR